MATHHNFKIKNGLEVGGTLIVNSSGQLQAVTAAGNLSFGDGLAAHFGASNDLRLRHSTNSFIENFTNTLRIINYADDSDITFESDNGSGGVTPYFRLDGSLAVTFVHRNIQTDDNVKLRFGNGADLSLFHDGTDSTITNSTGDLIITNSADDQDIVFQGDNGSGGVAEYIKLDGNNVRTKFSKDVNLQDSTNLYLGTSSDLRLVHNGADSAITNATGNLVLTNSADDKDIVFNSDAGDGGTAEYFRLDGSEVQNRFSKHVKLSDSVELRIGTDNDLKIMHSGSVATVDNYTGDFLIRQQVDDKDVIIQTDNGSGGQAYYFQADGSTGEVKLFHYGTEKIKTTSAGATVTGNLTISGDLTVDGTNTVLNTTTLDVEDKNITLNKGSGDTSSSADGAGITIQDAVDASNDATFNWNATNDRWELSHALNFQDGDPVTWGGNSIVQHTGSKTHIGDNSSSSTLTLQSGRMGIGTTSPKSMIHINQSSNNSADLLELGTAVDASTLRIENTDTTAGSYASLFLRAATSDARIAFIRTQANGGDLAIVLDTPTAGGGTERMRIKDNGRIGMGTNDPKSKLHVLDNGNNSSALLQEGTVVDTATIRVENDNTTVGSYASIYLRADTGDSRIAAIKKSSSTNDVDMAFILNDQSAGTNVERLRIVGETGNVGIGTATPSAGLHLFDRTLRMQKSAGDRKLEFIDNRTGANHYSIEHDTTQIYFYNVTTAEAPLKIRNNGSVIMSAGNIGIGTGNTPARKLEVMNGSGAAEMAISGTTGADLYFKPTDSYSAGGNFGIKVDGGTSSPYLSTMTISGYNNGVNDIMTLKGDQKVGIKTTSPSDDLHVGGIIRSHTSSTSKYIRVFGGNSGNFFDSYGNTLFIRPSGNTSLALSINGAGDIAANGIVTINRDLNASTPTSTNSNLFLKDTNALAAENGGAIVFSGIYDSSGNHIGQGPHIKAYKVNANSGDYSFGLKFATRQNGVNAVATAITIDETQQVGIGITAPSSKLHINDAITGDASQFEITNGAGAALKMGITGSGSNEAAHIKTHSGEDLEFHMGQAANSGTPRVIFKSDGKVGIGQATPLATLHVGSGSGSLNTAAELFIPGGAALMQTLKIGHGTSSATIQTDDATKPMKFHTGGNESVRIDTGGRVLINTTTSLDNTAQLHIAGFSSGRARITMQDVDGTNQKTFFSQSGGTTEFSTQNGSNYGNFSIVGWNGSNSTTFLKVDGPNGRVGIGHASPDTILHVDDATDPTIRVEDTDSGMKVDLQSNGSAGFVGTTTNSDFGIRANNNTRIHIENSGNVGIGTTSPTELLEVNGIIKADTLKIDNITFKDVDGSPTDEINLTTEFDGSNSTLSFEGSAGQLFSVTNDLSGTFFSVNDVSGIPSIEVVDDGTVKLARFSGNVGIGEGSPDAKLHVKDTTNNILRLETNQSAGGYIRFDEGSTERLRLGFGAQVFSAVPSATDVGLRSSNHMHFGTNGNNIRMTIASNGNVGIGVSVPDSKLHINGKVIAQTDSGYYIHNTSNSFRVALHDDGTRTRLFADGNGSNPHMTFNGGNVGVGLLGTAHPDTRFHVQGSGATVKALIECTDGNQAGVDLKNSEGHFRLITDNGGFFFYDQTDSRQPFTINSSGHVLIGTTNTNNVGSIDQMCIVGSTTNDEEVAYVLNVMEGSNNRRAKFFLDDDLGEYGFDATASSGVPRFVIRNATTETFTVTQQGRLGIGEPSPDNKVEAKGTDAAFIAHYNAQSRGGVAALSGQRVAFLSTSTNDDLVFGRTANPVASGGFVERMRIDNGTGNVGIGNTSPPQKLTVNGAVFITDDLTSPGSAGTYTYNGTAVDYSSNGTRYWSWGSGSARGTFSFIQLENDGTNQQTAMTIAASGNVGIGTVNPGSLLTVEGNIAVGDSDEIRLGASADLKLYHDGSNSYIDDSGTGKLFIRSNEIRLNKYTGEFMLRAIADGAVTLYYDNSAKLATTSTGVTVTGLLSATTKSFDIPHPTKEGMRLRYGVLEGPENGVYVRGKSDGYIIKLPEVWKGLVHEDSITVQLTAIGKPQDLYVDNIEDNTVYLGIHPGKPIGEYYYYIQAERKDVEKLEVEYGNPL